jgi:hypothetical protein
MDESLAWNMGESEREETSAGEMREGGPMLVMIWETKTRALAWIGGCAYTGPTGCSDMSSARLGPPHPQPSTTRLFHEPCCVSTVGPCLGSA